MEYGSERKTIELMAIGAAIGEDCISCLGWHSKKRIVLGIAKEEIQETVDMAKKVSIKELNKI